MRHGPRGGSTLMVLAVLSLFGPYLVGGIRTDQAFMYGVTFLMAVLMPWRWLGAVPYAQRLIVIATVWSSYVAVGLVGAISPPAAVPPRLFGNTLAGLDNLLLPLALMLFVVMNVNPWSRERAVRLTGGALAVGGAANGALAFAMTRVDLTAQLRPWWAAAEATGASTVADRAATLGRFSGLLNHPAEAGLLYGVAGLCAVYVWHDRPRLLYPLLAAITLGGLLSVSKVFLLVGFPLIVWQMLRHARGKFVGVLVGFAAAAGLAQAGFTQWSGFDYLLRLLYPPENGSLLTFYSAGRFGEQSTLSQVVDTALTLAPFAGVGAAGLRMPYDNGWVEALVVAGWLGVIVYSVTLLLLCGVAARCKPGLERSTAWCRVLLSIGTSAGLPALTANRSGAALWLLLGALAVTRLSRVDEPGPEVVEPEVTTPVDPVARERRARRERRATARSRSPARRPVDAVR